jgi:RNA polymerase sigma factor (sigma-70 family)
MNITPRFAVEDDDPGLLGRFTAYMELVVTHARIDCLRRQDYRKSEVSPEHCPTDRFGYEDRLPENKSEFDFEEGKLADAFSRLNLLRKRILTLVFVEGLPAREVAERLNCSVEYVYLQKHRALKKLRDQLMNGGDGNGE